MELFLNGMGAVTLVTHDVSDFINNSNSSPKNINLNFSMIKNDRVKSFPTTPLKDSKTYFSNLKKDLKRLLLSKYETIATYYFSDTEFKRFVDAISTMHDIISESKEEYNITKEPQPHIFIGYDANKDKYVVKIKALPHVRDKILEHSDMWTVIKFDKKSFISFSDKVAKFYILQKANEVYEDN